MKANRQPIKRPNMRRAVILFPSGLTLGNLFFGVFAIITASRGDFPRAAVYVMLGGICDALDGRVARATNAGSQFGEELDSLVDAISFGLAPAMIMYFATLNPGGWDWIFVFLFAACAVMRLARFNVEQAGTAKTYFRGLPSPAAGITLASYYWFAHSWMYNYGAVGNLPWQELMRFVIAVLAFLMISNIPYPAFPRTGFRSLREIGASVLVLGSIALLVSKKLEYFFPLALIYVVWGVLRRVFFGLFERRQPTVPYDLSEGEDEEEDDEFDIAPAPVHASRPHRAVEPEPRTDRGRARSERPERPERGPRTDREARPARGEAARVSEAGDVPPERGERPQRTEAERAARREKREKRDKQREKREGKAERPPRPDRPERAAAATGVDAIALGEPAAAQPSEDVELGGDEQVIGNIPGGAESEAAGTASGATRKRKRRRRRGARDRAEGAIGGEGSDGGSDDGEGGDGGDGGDEGDEGTPSRESRSPYAPPTVTPVPEHAAPSTVPSAAPQGEARPFTPSLPAPTPATAPPAAPSSSEPGE